MLPPDWQSRMVDVLRGAAEPDERWFGGGVHLGPRQQVAIYQEQYRLRLVDAVVEDLPGLGALLGDAMRDLAWAWVQSHPPHSWTLNRICLGLPEWLESEGAPVVQVEMARLDLAVTMGFEAASGRTVRPEDLASLPPLRLQPHVSLLRLTHDVHRVRSAVIGEREPPLPSAGQWWLVVFRSGLRMRHRELDEGAWRVLHAISAGLSLPEALEAAVGALAEPPDAARLQGWFADFARLDLVEVG